MNEKTESPDRDCEQCGYAHWCCDCGKATETTNEGETENMSLSEAGVSEVLEDLHRNDKRIANVDLRVKAIEDAMSGKHEPLAGLTGHATISGAIGLEPGLPSAADAYRTARTLAALITTTAGNLAKARHELEDVISAKKDIEAEQMANVCEEKDGAGKAVHSNDNARKAEQKIRLANDAGYQYLCRQSEQLTVHVEADQLELSDLQRRFEVEKLALGFWSRA